MSFLINSPYIALIPKLLIDAMAIALAAYLLWSVGSMLLPSYFSLGYLVEFRSFATIETARSFQSGLNPFSLESPNGTTNLYTFLWPLLIAKIGNVLDISSSGGLRLIAFSVNLAILIGTIFTLMIIGLKEKINISLLSAIVIVVLFANIIKFNLGEWPYAAGINLSVLGVILGVNASTAYWKFWASSILLFLACSFKVYFVICAIPLVISSLFYMAKSKINFVRMLYVAIFWLLALIVINSLYPTYFTHVIGMQRIFIDSSRDIDHEAKAIFLSYVWYYMIVVFFVHNILSRRHSIETLVQFLYIIAAIIYVTFVMGRHGGNYISYTIHILTPLLIFSLVLIKGEDFRRLAGVSILFIIAGSWHFMPPVKFGILEAKILKVNEQTIANVKDIIEELKGKELYISPVFASLAHSEFNDYIDAGNREYISKWEARKKSLDDSWIYNYLGWSNIVVKEKHFNEYYKIADYVICTYRCPAAGKGLIDTQRPIGVVRTAWGQVLTVRLYSRDIN